MKQIKEILEKSEKISKNNLEIITDDAIETNVMLYPVTDKYIFRIPHQNLPRFDYKGNVNRRLGTTCYAQVDGILYVLKEIYDD